MRPYYQDELVTLYHGDCLEVLAKLPVIEGAKLFTDPPYNVGKDYGRAVTTPGLPRSTGPGVRCGSRSAGGSAEK